MKEQLKKLAKELIKDNVILQTIGQGSIYSAIIGAAIVENLPTVFEIPIANPKC